MKPLHHERTIADRMERFVARMLLRLPHSTLIRLSGAPQVVIDGQALHPEMQFTLSARKRRGIPPMRAGTPESARRRMTAEARRYASDPLPLTVRDLRVPSSGHLLAARHYAPPEQGGPHPLLVFFHGGGFALGDLETHDEPCRLFCHHAGVHVLSVEYRLAPEHPFPAAIDDGEAAVRWAFAHAAELGVDPSRIGVGGDSAGANIATVVTRVLEREGAAPRFQFLIYPVVDSSSSHPSRSLFGSGFFLEAEDISFFNEAYIGGRPELVEDARVSPLRAPAPPRAPSVVITAAFDPLRDEGEAYAAWLAKHGVPTTHRRFPGLIHGFINMTSVSRAAEDAVLEMAMLLRRLSRTSTNGEIRT